MVLSKKMKRSLGMDDNNLKEILIISQKLRNYEIVNKLYSVPISTFDIFII